jgi:hypothetical protein
MRGQAHATTDSTEESPVGGGYRNCAVIGRAASHEDCSRHSVHSANAAICKWCPSPSKWCLPCFKQGVSEQFRLPINPKTGRCLFHDEHGDDAKRDSSTRAFTFSSRTAAKDKNGGEGAIRPKRAYNRRPQDGPSDSILATVKHDMAELPDKLFEKIADNIGDLQPESHEHRLVQFLHRKLSTKQIAEELRQNQTKVSLNVSQLCHKLEVPRPTSAKSTILAGWFMREVVHVAYNRHLSRLNGKA